ncbi:MAG: hypothetical protein PHF67_04070 [Candidatus Nanoarchaeia archaeon]|nr:hypothetical protein [Candidatus Nanoarchaeia archaeon]
MILIINICKEKLHYYEFVKPIEDILRYKDIKFFTKPYNELTKRDLKKTKKVIICGTSIYDNEFLENCPDFDWLLNFNKPVLGICGGMHLIGTVFGNKTHTKKTLLKKKTEIGFYNEKFEEDFLGLIGEKEVYHLHNYYVRFGKDFLIFTGGKCAQAIKHREREIYGVLFHPEVRNKDLITNFCFL